MWRDLRQAFRSKVFRVVAAFFVFLPYFHFLFLEDAPYQKRVDISDFVCFVILAFGVIPLQIWRGMVAEGQSSLLAMTPLSPSRVLGGRFAAALVMLLAALVCMLPLCLMRSVTFSLSVSAQVLVLVKVMSLGGMACALAMLLAALPRLLALAVAFGFWCCFGAVARPRVYELPDNWLCLKYALTLAQALLVALVALVLARRTYSVAISPLLGRVVGFIPLLLPPFLAAAVGGLEGRGSPASLEPTGCFSWRVMLVGWVY